MSRRSVLSISAIMMLGLTASPNSAISQQWSRKDQLVGTWTLASWEHVLPNGSKVQSYGSNPKGIVVFDAKGRFFLMFVLPDLPKIASNDPATATSEEAKDLLAGSIAYFGTYGVNDADRVINLRLEASTFNKSARERSEWNDHLSHGRRTSLRNDCVGWRQNQHRLEAGGSGLWSRTRLERRGSACFFPS
jgi:hypothetical protein